MDSTNYKETVYKIENKSNHVPVVAKSGQEKRRERRKLERKLNNRK